jgi:hypothetical protein
MPMHSELGRLIHVLNPYSEQMEFPEPIPQGAISSKEGRAPTKTQVEEANIAKIQVEVDNYHGEWNFRGQIHKIEKGLRITYRYPVLDKNKKPTGVYATEHLLIGYAGGNGN